MSSQVQLIGGAFQSTTGVPLAGGTLTFVLSQDAQVTVGSTTEEVCSGIEIIISLDENGNAVTTPPQLIWGNDVLSPANTFYTVSAYSAEGQLAWGPNYQQVTGSPTFNLGGWVPGVINVIGSGNPFIASLTTNGTSGDATVQNGVLNIPDYSGGAGLVSSVFGRTGAVVAETGDYTVAQVTGAAPIASPTFTGTVTAPTIDATYLNTTSTAVIGDYLNVDPDLYVNVGTSGASHFWCSGGNLSFNRNVHTEAIDDDTIYAFQIQHYGTGVAATDYLAFEVYEPSATTVTQEALCINGLGNVGIGIANPTSLFQVNGAAALGSMSTADATITGGTINGTPIGATTPSTGAFTTGVFGGILTAPTAATGTNTTQVATTAFVETALAQILNNCGSAALPTASIPAGGASLPIGFSVPYANSNSVFVAQPAVDVTTVSGYGSGGLTIHTYYGNVGGLPGCYVKVCNPTANAITPGALTVNVAAINFAS